MPLKVFMKMRYPFFIVNWTVTARSPVSVIQSAHAFRLSCSNRLVTASQNTHAFCLSSTLVRQKMTMKCSRSRMTASIYQSSTPGLLFSVSSGLPLRGWSSVVILEKQLANGHENRKMPRQTCWSYPKVFVLELQDSSGLTNIIILRCNHGIVDFF